MRKLKLRRPSASLTVAMLALVVALGGTASAGVPAHLAKLINGSSIKKRSIAGNRLKSNTLTGAQIKESALGQVPSAAKADTATKADSATTATTAATAANASHAATADHAAAADQATNAAHAASVSSVQVFGPTSAAAGTDNKTLATYGPFTIVGTCDTHGGSELFADVSITSTEAHSAAGGDSDSNADFGPGDSVDIKQDTSSGGAPETSNGYDDTFDAMAPSGRAFTGTVQSWVSQDASTCKWQGSLVITG